MIQFGKVDVQQTLFVDTFSYKSKSRSKSKSKSISLSLPSFCRARAKVVFGFGLFLTSSNIVLCQQKYQAKQNKKQIIAHPSHQKASWSLDSKSVPSRV